MPGCAAVGCNNRSEKGYIMKCFPRDPKLRKIWQERVARADWEPSNNSFLCHVHFEPQEWSITQSGRIRLKKNAVPSIFTITSTRKSPKKRIKLVNTKKENTAQNDFAVEYLENDTELSSTGHVDEKDSDFQDTEETSVQSNKNKKSKQRSKSTEVEERENFQRAYERIHSDLRDENVIMVSDDNLTDMGNLVKRDNVEMQLAENKETRPPLAANSSTNAQTSSTVIKEEIKLEVVDHNTFDDSYDEIEEKLKQICDGGSTEDENYNNGVKRNSVVNNHKENERKSNVNGDSNNKEHKVTLPINANNLSTKNEIGHILIDKRENVEIIFGAESGDEKSHVCQSTTHIKYPAVKNDKTNENSLRFDNLVAVKEEKKVFTEDIEENFTKDEVHVIPNMRAAMKRKRRTREEIMKSIKKSIKNTTEQDANSVSNSELSENIEQEARQNDDSTMEAAKFIIKVTGDPDDVTEIIEELSSNARGKQAPQKFSAPYRTEENDAFVTSVITVLSPKNSKDANDNDSSIPVIKDEYSNSKNAVSVTNHSSCNERLPVSSNTVHSLNQCQFSCLRNSTSWSDDEGKNPVSNSTVRSPNGVPHQYEELLERMKIQEDVIAKLTDQLIIYKDLENNLRYKNTTREVQTKEVETLTHKMNTRSSSAQSSLVNKKNLESKQRLIEDLSNRVNYFEEMNKKLMKTVTLESQQKRKLEGQIKQKDNRIKELNWKLEKASKYLERAEKNTNTYRRKMLNMQTIMRRKKLLDEKMSRFSEMLIDSSKQEFSEKALSMAVEIRKTCGRNGYDKLLACGFPLPPLPALRKRFVSDDFTDYNESDVDRLRNVSAKNKGGKMHCVKNEMEIDTKDSGLSESVTKETEFDGAETVTGTVQDIFDENNDGDDFSTNELREHFILQLNAVM